MAGNRPDYDQKRLLIEVIGAFHEYGLSLPTRAIYLGSEHDDSGDEHGTDYLMAERFVKNLHILESLGDDPINVIANNVGGDVYHGMACYDAIKSSPCEVHMRVVGQAMSMGSIILQAADKRIMAPNAKQMIHYGYFAFGGHSLTLQKWAKEERKVLDWIEQLYAERMKMDLAEVRDMLDHDTILNAEECLDLGLVDEIG